MRGITWCVLKRGASAFECVCVCVCVCVCESVCVCVCLIKVVYKGPYCMRGLYHLHACVDACE
jgi:hypothetical protein